MKHELFQSSGLVAKDGYRLQKYRNKFYVTDGIEADSFQARVFLEEHINFEEFFSLSPNNEPIRYTIYSPFNYRDEKRKSSLFLTFAENEITNESILEFANRFGLLFSRKVPREGVNFIRLSSRKVIFAEPLELWQQNIKEMRLMVELWSALKEKRRNDLLIKLYTKKKQWVRPGGNMELIFVGAKNKEISAEFRMTGMDYERLRTDVYYACRAFLGRYIKRRLDSYDVPDYWDSLSDGKVKGIFERPDAAISTASMIWHSEEKSPRLVITPTSLLACIWLQFARAVDGDIDYRRCAVCPTQIEISLSKNVGHRVDKKTCSDNCRKRLSNKTIKRELTALRRSSQNASVKSSLGKKKSTSGQKKAQSNNLTRR